jgi:uncharacterized protein
VQTMQVTAAVRDAKIGAQQVAKGDHIVLGPDEGLLACAADRTEAIVAGLRRFEPGFELLTIYRGQGVSNGELDALRAALATEMPDVEIEVIDGGQPHYSFLVSAE